LRQADDRHAVIALLSAILLASRGDPRSRKNHPFITKSVLSNRPACRLPARIPSLAAPVIITGSIAMSLYGNTCFFGIAPGLILVAPAAAQTSDPAPPPATSAATAAIDAFGERVGINQVGLYSEYQTRGFDLMASSGAFRLDGFYYHPGHFPSESLVAGSSVNVGIAATGLDLPSPTGVIAFRLRDPGPRTSLSVTTGFRDQATAHIDALGTLVSADGTWGVVGHALVEPDANRGTGEDGPYLSAGGVIRWKPGPGTSVRLFGDYGRSRSDGDIGVLAAGEGVAPALRPRHRYGPDWARSSSQGFNIGALAEHRGGRWSLGASAIRSERHAGRSDYTVLEIDRQGGIMSTLYSTPSVESRSDSAEVKVARTFPLFGAEHRLGLAVRQRHTVTGRAEATAFPAGHFTIGDGPVDVPQPTLPAQVARGRDVVDQRIVSATYGLQVGDAIDLRLGAHSNRYEKTVRDFTGQRSRNLDSTWLYSASAVWRPASRLRLFASYVAGLEESGTAPSAAVNRGEVLPPVTARQYELGARFDLTPRLGLIAAGFDIEKPIYGLRPDGRYAPVGTVRHRGIEASLTGQLLPGTTVVLGANIVQPRLSGEEVDAGLIDRVAPGVSRFNATVSVEQRITPVWSADFYLLHEGGRRRDSVSPTEVAAVPFAIAGMRYDWTIDRTRLSLRAQWVNAFDVRGYYATPYGQLVPVTPQTWRLLLSASF
jgi:iron complex outermembrane receptor protein